MKDAYDKRLSPSFIEDLALGRIRLLELFLLRGWPLEWLPDLTGDGANAYEPLIDSSLTSPSETCSVICDISVRSCKFLPTKGSFRCGSFLCSSMAKFLISAASRIKDQSVCVACAGGRYRLREQEVAASACLMILKMKRQLGQQTFWKRSLGSALSSSRLLMQGLREIGLREDVFDGFSGVFVLKISDFSTTFSPFFRINLLSIFPQFTLSHPPTLPPTSTPNPVVRLCHFCHCSQDNNPHLI